MWWAHSRGKLTSTIQETQMHGGAVPCSPCRPLKQLHGPQMLLSGYGPAGKAAVPENRNGHIAGESQNSSSAALC